MTTLDFSREPPLAVDQIKIDGDRYVTRAWADRERTALWQQSWLLAGLASDLVADDATLAVDLGAESVIIARHEGTLHAYHNACTHRGTRLLEEGAHCNAQIRCPYHAWCFNRDGSLRSVPNADSFPAGLPETALRLKPVRVAQWKGLIFVSLAEDGPPLSAFLGTLAERMAPYDLDAMVLLEDQTAEVACNWKAIIDNFAELYHVDYLHPQHKSFVNCTGEQNELYEHGHTGLHLQGFTTDERYPVPRQPTEPQRAALAAVGLNAEDFVDRVPQIPAAITAAKRAQSGRCGYDYSAFSDAELTRVYQYNLFPNVILSGTCEGLWVLRSRPHPTDPERSFLDKWTLHLPPDPALGGDPARTHGLHATSDAAKVGATSERVARDVFDYRDVLEGRKSLTITIDQDLSLLARVQAGARSSGFERAWLSQRETRVAHFHRALNHCLDTDS